MSSTTDRWSASRGLISALVVILALLGATEAEGQSWEHVRDQCAGSGPGLSVPCLELGLAAQGIRAGMGLLATQGHPVPGSVSTVGRRLATVPRAAVGLRVGGTSLRVPDLRGPVGEGGGMTPLTPSSQLSLALGVVDGFRLLPTVGGVLSVDLLGSAGVTHLSSSRGFGGPAVTYGAGLRVGLLRESFTLPGVSVTGMRYGGTTVRFGEIFPDGREVRVSPSTTSLRLSVGKDFLALGLTGGAGWDRYSGRVETRVRTASGGEEGIWSGSVPSDDRLVVFGGGNLTFLVLQLAGEVGWAAGPGESPPAGAGVDPSRAGLFGSLAVRVTY